MCYAPTNNAEEDDKDSFYAELQSVVDKVPGRDMLILMGDMNAKVGSSNTDREREMGRHGLGDMNENGEMLADFCAVNNLVIGGTLFPHCCHHKATWILPDHQTENQIDHVIIRQCWRTSLQDVRARRGADSNSRPVRDKEGKLLTHIDDQLARWKEHFQEVLNRPPPQDAPQLEPEDLLHINTGPITKAEIRKSLRSLKNGKATGTDNIPPEALKEGGEVIVDQLHHLLNLIWTTEEIPMEWKKGLLVKLPKHGDLSQCSKWRGITLLSIPSKVLTRIILERMKKSIDQKLRDEQAGFRKERSCINQIATLRVIVEQTMEWQTPLFVCFIDFDKAFDSVDRQAIWDILRHYGVPDKIISVIRRLYEGFACQVIHSGRLFGGLRDLHRC